MDELEFRRHIMSQPNSKDPALSELLKTDPAKKEFAQQMHNLDEQLASAMKVPVPDGLADRLILRQAFDQESTQLIKRSRWHLAMAASVAFFIGLGISQLNIQDVLSPSIGSIALAHVNHEMPFTQEIDEAAPLSAVNAKLVRYGLNMNEAPEHVYYVNHCHYHNEPALHMIVQGKMGKVTLFVVPEGEDLKASDYFADNQMKGEVFKLHNASMVLVGDKNEPLEAFGKELSKKIQPMLI